MDRRSALPTRALILPLAVGVGILGWFAGGWIAGWRGGGRESISADDRASGKVIWPKSTPDPVGELPLTEQIAAVKAGKSTAIHVTLRPIGDEELALFADEERIETLHLDHAENTITSEGCQTLAAMPKLTHLRIRGGAIDDAGLGHLSNSAALEILNLPQCQCTDRGVAQLANMPRLKHLRLASRDLTSAAASELTRFPALTKLHLIDVPITDAGLAELAKMPRLGSLYLDGSQVTDSGLTKLLAERPDLHVHIDQQHHDRDPRRH